MQLANTESYDAVRNGVRLVLAYDQTSSSFIGTVENMTDQSITAVRVEVHLSSGTELGPTPRLTLTAGQKESVKLSAAGQSFDWWKAHAESGEGGGEHSREREGEHKGEGREEHGKN
ncbi:hypothetical protein MJD09_26230 [bacterium]|nr:hypothetical protein [bacterium]